MKPEIDWKTEAVVCVILKESTSAFRAPAWKGSGDQEAELFFDWNPIERCFSGQYPALFQRVDLKDLKTIAQKVSGRVPYFASLTFCRWASQATLTEPPNCVAP